MHTVRILLFLVGWVFAGFTAAGLAQPDPSQTSRSASTSSFETKKVLKQYCQGCHNDRMLTGNISFEEFDITSAARDAETTRKSEKMVRKLRAKMMPPPGVRQPQAETLLALVETLESVLDKAAAADPNPGYRTFQRLNRHEYERAIHDLLMLEIDTGDYLPLDTMSANFDNIADVQMLSATLLDGYLRAASEISQLAVGNPNATPKQEPPGIRRLGWGHGKQKTALENAQRILKQETQILKVHFKL